MKFWFYLLLSAALSWHFMDMESTRFFDGVMLPITFLLCLMTIVVKLFLSFGKNDSKASHRDFDDWDDFDSGDGFGD